MFDLAGINMDLRSEPVPTGTSAGPIRPEISSATGLAPDTQIVSISHDQIAARRWNMYAGPSLLELHLSCMTVLCSRLKKTLPILRWSSPLQNRPALQWKLRLDAWVSVRQKANIPVVMHGGSGVSDGDFRKAILSGVRKVNYYTYMAMAGDKEIASQFQMGCIPVERDGKKYKYCYSLVESDKETPIMYHEIVRWGTKAMKENCKKAMKVFFMQ